MSELSDETMLRAAIGIALTHLAGGDVALAVDALERALAPLETPEPTVDPPGVGERRTLEMQAGRERCAVTIEGHLFYAGRSSCARCFEPKPVGWGL